ncbi:response regulator transcription factor [Crateriforma spongiae]|uniref:response regulator transcription factor n=1 Tax=Crateriforma spongiae TaxID=2724528 RepID=UPI0014477177|nr:response regulator transcription factor [Crateriforma spongiae]
MRFHILVVEDEKHLAVGIKYNLEADSYRVTIAEDGQTALRIMESVGDSVDLVILDLMLPGMSGYTVCERLRSAGRTLPILMLSARTLAEDRTRGFDVGANQYMSKPFELDELLSRVKNLLHTGNGHHVTEAPKPPPPALRQIEFGHVQVDFDTHECRAGDRDVRMTSKELRLLRYFVENPNRVISRAELLSEVWEMNGNLQTRAVDQFIARLRKIIEVDSGNPVHLLTVRDAGYRFVLNPEGKDEAEGG